LKKRLFVGIPLPEEFSKPITSFENKYSDLKPINWVSERNLHITIYYIGSIEEEFINIISNQINFLISNTNPFALVMDDVCFMKGRKNQKMLWAKFNESPGLNELAKRIEGVCLPYIDKREPFISTIPHITIARMKQFKDIERINTDIYLKTKNLVVDKCCLYESISIEGGVRYEVLNTYYLKTN
jgi:2'-5' RNA ligase